MNKFRYRVIFIIIMLCSLFYVIPVAWSDSSEKAIDVLKKQGADVIIFNERMFWLQRSFVINLMDIKPGMTIADVGAGVGVFTFPLSEKLKDSGKVYAIDTYKPNLDCIIETSKEKGYKNIVPVLIDSSNSETFYKSQSFDIILVCDMLGFIPDVNDFLNKIRPSLKKDTGRLFLIEPRIPAIIDSTDIYRSPWLLLRIADNPPIFNRLSKESQDIIMSQVHAQSMPVQLLGKQYMPIIRDLNAMLSDQTLFNDIVNYYFFAYDNPQVQANAYIQDIHNKDYKPIENPSYLWPLYSQLPANMKSYMAFLLAELDESDAFKKKKDELSYREKRFIQMANKSLLFCLLHISSTNYMIESLTGVVFRSKRGLISKTESAGFKLVTDNDTLPKYYILAFKRKD